MSQTIYTLECDIEYDNGFFMFNNLSKLFDAMKNIFNIEYTDETFSNSLKLIGDYYRIESSEFTIIKFEFDTNETPLLIKSSIKDECDNIGKIDRQQFWSRAMHYMTKAIRLRDECDINISTETFTNYTKTTVMLTDPDTNNKVKNTISYSLLKLI